MSHASLQYPKKSHRKKSVVLPKESAKLAEFFGIMLGDGGINNLWQANVTMNAVKDAAYSRYVAQTMKELFGISPAMRKRKDRQALVISLASIAVVDFLVSRGLPRGNKLRAGAHIPAWITAKPSLLKACVRGLVDTDGCIFVHRHKVAGKEYKNIGLCFTSYSPQLLRQVGDAFEQFGIMPHISAKGRDIYLYQESAVAHYLRVFRTSNPRIGSVYKKWRDG